MKRAPVAAEDFRIPARLNRMPVIGVTAGRIITERIDLDMAADATARCRPISTQDAIKVAVVARHGKNDNIGRGFVHGFGLKRGAIASSVGHDSHNITVVGVDDADMAAAVNRIIELKGGFVVVVGRRGPRRAGAAGRRADEPRAVRDGARAAASRCGARRRTLGCTLPEPFLQVAFLPLPVIPHLKITDRGLFDVDRFALIE